MVCIRVHMHVRTHTHTFTSLDIEQLVYCMFWLNKINFVECSVKLNFLKILCSLESEKNLMLVTVKLFEIWFQHSVTRLCSCLYEV